MGERRESTIPYLSETKTSKQSCPRSNAWKHFTRLADDRDRSKCNYCGQIIKCKAKNGTSAMNTHTNLCKAYKSLVDARDENQKKLALNQDGNGTSGLVAVSYCPIACRSAIAKMIVLDELPFAFVEKIGFRNFCNIAILQFDIPSRRTITRDIVGDFTREKVMLMRFFSEHKQRVCLTTDIWTAPTTGVSYMVVVAHFIDVTWHLHRKVISFKPIFDHKGETIGNQLVSCLAEWGIEKVFTVTVDNASANDAGIRHLKNNVAFSGDESLILKREFMHVRCAAHILNLIVRDGLARINNGVVAIRNTVKYVRSFHMRLGPLRLDKNVTRGSLTLDCTTRLNSTYLMLDNALKYRSMFDKLALEDRPYDAYFQEEDHGEKRVGPPSSLDWDDVTRLVEFLKLFYESTLVFSAYSKVTA